MKKTYLKRSAFFCCRLFLAPLPPSLQLAKAGFTERRKTQREIRIEEIKAEIAFFFGGGGFGAK